MKSRKRKPRCYLPQIWAEILELPDIRRNDDFFGLGGDLLMGAIVAAQVHTALGIELSLGEIADHTTVSTLAAFLDKCRRTRTVDMPPVVRVPRAASMPLTTFQEAFWSSRGEDNLRTLSRHRTVEG